MMFHSTVYKLNPYEQHNNAQISIYRGYAEIQPKQYDKMRRTNIK